MSKTSQPTPREVLINDLMKRWKLHLCEAIRIVGSVEAGEDVLQETAVKCLTKTPATAPSFPDRYVSSMVRNAALDYLRRHKREIAMPFDEEENLARAGITPLCGQVHLEKRQELQTVANTLSELPDRTRRAFLRHRLTGVRQNQIARELKVSTTLVNFLIKDAEASCRQALRR